MSDDQDMYPDAAMEVLEQGGLISKPKAPIMNEDYDEIDHLVMGAPPAVKFEQPGDTVSGRITRVYQVQQTDYDTREPLWWEDGQPKMQVVVVLDVAGEGLRSLYIGSRGMRDAIREACRAVDRGLRPDGYLTARYTQDGQPFKKGARPPKEYQAGYDPPGRRPLDERMPAPNLKHAELSQGDSPPF
jgi:hypothetical protein